MIHGFNTKTARVLIAQSVASTATVTGTVDTADFDFMALDIDVGTASSAPGLMKLSEATTSDGTYTDVAAFLGGTGFTVPAADTSNDQTIRFNVSLAVRERFLKVTITPGATQLMSVNARLSNKDETPDTDALQGCSEVVTG